MTQEFGSLTSRASPSFIVAAQVLSQILHTVVCSASARGLMPGGSTGAWSPQLSQFIPRPRSSQALAQAQALQLTRAPLRLDI